MDFNYKPLMTAKQQTQIILILGALTTISPFAIDMYLPGFPAIAKDLDTSISNVQLSLTSYFIGISLGQMIYGPLLDRFGRKSPLYIGLVVYFFASIGCAFASSAEGLIIMRFLQALGGCAGMIAAQTLVRDLFPSDRTAQAYSWISLVVAVSPMVAPTVGGYFTTALGWQSVFIALAVISLLLTAMVFSVLPEGKKADKTISLKPRPVLKNFYGVIKQPQFLTYCIAGGLASAAPFAFIAGSPDVFINIFRMNEKEFGWVFAIVGAVIIGCTQLNHLLLKRYRSDQVVMAAMVYQLFVGTILLAGGWFSLFDKTTLIILCIVFLAAHGLNNANTTALSLAPFSRNTGSAASLLGTFRMASGAIVSGLVAIFHNQTALPMIVMMVAPVCAGLIMLIIGKTVIRFKLREKKEKETYPI